jgi:hypothetical protein
LKERDHFKKPTHTWENNIKMDLQDIRWEGVDWIHLSWDRNMWQALVDMVMNLQVPHNAVNFLPNSSTSQATSFSMDILSFMKSHIVPHLFINHTVQ